MKFESAQPNRDVPGVLDIMPEELAEKKHGVVLVDVRRPDEFVGELGHIPKSQLMVLDSLPEKIHELPKDKTIVFICRSGARSARASAFARESGFDDTYNLKGGMLLWNELNFEVER